MASADEIRLAAVDLIAARATFVTAQAALNAADATALAACATEQAALGIAATAFEAALTTAREDPGWVTANQDMLDAAQARNDAEAAFATAAAAYDGQ